MGTRLQGWNTIKPLVPIEGIPLLERVMRCAREAGIREFTLVTGYQHHLLEEHFSAPEQKHWQVNLVHNPDWTLPNGRSVLCARGVLPATFNLLMSDHLFHPGLLRALNAMPWDGRGLILAVDRRTEHNPWVDLEDVTRVQVDLQGRIERIGKLLPGYNAFDTGLFRCSHDLFPFLEKAAARGDHSLSAGVLALAEEGRALTCSPDPLPWLDVDDPLALSKTPEILRLLNSGQDVL